MSRRLKSIAYGAASGLNATTFVISAFHLATRPFACKDLAWLLLSGGVGAGLGYLLLTHLRRTSPVRQGGDR